MRTERVSSVGLKLGFNVGMFESIEEMEKQAGKAGIALEICNKYLRQKGALVAARDALSEAIEKLGFVMKTKEVTKTLKDGTSTTSTVADETEEKHIDRFRAAIGTGTFTIDGWNATNLEDQLQALADSLGVFNNDASERERVAKERTPAKVYLEKADLIIANGNTDKWVKTFTREKIEFKDFTTAASVDANDTAAVASAKANDRTNLAWAIKARVEKQTESYS